MRFALMLMLCQLAVADKPMTDAEIDKAEKTVKVYRKSDPPDTCTELEDIASPPIEVIDEVGHEKILRRMAAKKGANAIMVIGRNGASRKATIYKCKK